MHVTWHPKALDDINGLEPNIKKRIEHKIGELKDNPTHYAVRLKGCDLFKLRVGDYRVLLKIESSEIKIILIEHRSRVYNEISRRL